MNLSNLVKLIGTIAPVVIGVAETVHPLPGNGAAKLTTAVSLMTQILGAFSAAGAIPADVVVHPDTVVAAINGAVAQANASGGVPKLPTV